MVFGPTFSGTFTGVDGPAVVPFTFTVAVASTTVGKTLTEVTALVTLAV